MQWWHTNDIADPPAWQRMQVYPNPMLGSEKSARMVNSAGEEFFNQQQDDPLAYGPYTVQLKALARQVHAGKARYDGGYFAGFDHCDAREVDAYTTYGKTYRQLGLRFPEELVETAVTAHYRQGGIDVDTEHDAVVGARPLRRGRARRPQLLILHFPSKMFHYIQCEVDIRFAFEVTYFNVTSFASAAA